MSRDKYKQQMVRAKRKRSKSHRGKHTTRINSGMRKYVSHYMRLEARRRLYHHPHHRRPAQQLELTK